jgi:cell wall-associated NlpC family hydrolase
MVLGVAGTGVAGASPTDDVIDRAATIQRTLLDYGEQIDALSEQYNAAAARRDLALRQIAFGETAARSLAGYRNELRSAASRAAAALYRGAGSSTPLALVRQTATHRQGRQVEYTEAAGASLRTAIDRYRRVERQLAERARHLGSFRQYAEQQAAVIAGAKARAELLQQKQQALLAGVQGELASVLRLRRAAEDPDAAGLQNRLLLLGVGALPVAPSPVATKVVEYAIAQLGKPYVFAAAGPATFDCSGLTMMAWRQVGVSMAHFAASQYAQFPKVSIDELQPGDLVFFYPTIHHVGIYIGDGKMIHAPHTGDVVRVASIFRRSIVGAVRPG